MSLFDPLANVANFFIGAYGCLPLPIRAFINLSLGVWFAMALLLMFFRLK